MTLVQNSRAYIRPSRSLSTEAQREACERVAAGLGVECVVYVEGEQTREAWVRALRADEVAIVGRLDMLAAPRREGRRPSVDFTTALAAVQQRAAYIVDAKTGVTSRDSRRWSELVEWAVSRVVQGRKLLSGKAREMAAASHKSPKRKRAKSQTVELWQSAPMCEEFERWGSHWRDPKYPSGDAAWDALPQHLKDEFGSVWTVRKIFGERHPGKGLGRPKAKRGKSRKR